MPRNRATIVSERPVGFLRETGPQGLQRAVTDLLTAERIFWLRMNSGTFSGEYKGKKRFIKGQEPGTADLLCSPLIGGFPVWLWLEVKPEGKQQTEVQAAFQKRVEELGHYYLLVRDPFQVVSWLTTYRRTCAAPV